MRRTVFLAVGVIAIGVSGVIDPSRAASVPAPADTDPYAAVIAEAVQRFNIPATWIRAVMSAESGGDIGAISSKGALGLMQIMPATWSDLRTRYGLGSDPFDVHDNILAGAAFLREMHDRYGLPGFLAAYNAGPGRYEDYRDRQRPLPPETRAYVAGLLSLIGQGGAESLLPVSHPDPLFWTRAPIFVMQSDDARKGVPVAMKLPSKDVRSDIIAHGLAPVRPLSDGLFVASSASVATP
ncbi:murein transglycosylase [Komagataeibacter nataicola]|uniref:Lytic transglycosylase domain-containing protein n=2 Tax=Acetobacteraceae TaxID=433 RepID=A0A939KMX6_9PROT|nr:MULTISPECIES: lytic transglycosylase domain-containing protein [Acetobacteraceae]AQU88586.1 murein transglycosylase [Komagataeibacter nataicola]MBO1325030.1 lytic transglycosylase domain-containing protein [Acetobacter garciniae]MBX0344999.1 lytic transglycosylase domain-containing protein [Acetobacter garciniae]PYD65527.1 murein transglycosylase [Komagataeibacter nataicola]WNM08712.1 lytic transglycosylase domain-containing protein [Komagataeibacter nataicola]